MYLPLNRTHAKIVAVTLIAIGAILMPDILVPTPGTDVINIFLAMPLADWLNIEYFEALMLTFVIAFVIMIAGFFVYPYNTKKLIHGRLIWAFHYIKARPALIIAAIVVLFILHAIGEMLYANLWEYAKQLALSIINGGA